MTKLDEIIQQLHLRRVEVEQQFTELMNSEGKTEEIVRKLQELRRRQETTDPARREV